MDDVALTTALPDDPAILKQIILTRTRERDEWKNKHDDKDVRCLRLEVELLRLKKLYYGPRGDKLTSLGDVNQLLLSFAAELEGRPVNLADVPDDVPGEELKTVRRVR